MEVDAGSERQPISSPPSFGKFAELPKELQLKIWNYACYIPRNVDISFEHRPHKYKFHRRSKEPPLLSVCKDSREEALRIYISPFEPGTEIPVRHPIRVNFAVDTLIIDLDSYRDFRSLDYIFSRIGKVLSGQATKSSSPRWSSLSASFGSSKFRREQDKNYVFIIKVVEEGDPFEVASCMAQLGFTQQDPGLDIYFPDAQEFQTVLEMQPIRAWDEAWAQTIL
ncbi:hypothetical protein BP6252_01296 [Coleophoma cylindrospora]|uniref:2EXR domain-containing protein n=1 Tax=Coleophoma cylindrospora TaxID=1849047 RepID=A0A3D8SSQ1_9HELO|nr:hypothetical protein BP6252_01296 [Coleophoma cylindrospora]